MQAVSSNHQGWEEIDDKERNNLFAAGKNGLSDSEAVVKEDVLLNHLEVTVVEAEKRMNGPLALKEYYTVYLIETKALDNNWSENLSQSSSVWRRYSEFELLKLQLENNYPDSIIPPLPEKKALYTRQNQSSDNLDPLFVDRRRVGLESFLLRVTSHPVLSHDKIFLKFLQMERDWSELELNVEGGVYVQQAEFKLKSMNASLRLKKHDEDIEYVRRYGSELQTSLGNLLRVRVRLADRLFAIHKLHANYGRVFSEWSALEKTMGDGLQKAGHYMDCYAASIDSHLEEEDIVADQLKEYLHFGQALQALCSRHHMAEYQVIKAESNLSLHKYNKERHNAGDSTLTKLWGKWTGATETYEEKQAKMLEMDRNVDEAELQLEKATSNLTEFTSRAKNQVECFKKRKNCDLKESLTDYIMLQLKFCKSGLQTWKHVKEALQEEVA